MDVVIDPDDSGDDSWIWIVTSIALIIVLIIISVTGIFIYMRFKDGNDGSRKIPAEDYTGSTASPFIGDSIIGINENNDHDHLR